MTDAVLARPGAELAYRIVGEGPFLGISHGMMWSRAVEDGLGLMALDELGARRRLLRYDARGHGRSTGRPEPADYTWPALTDDLFAMAGLSGSADPVDWAGSSMGTGTLLWAATRRPERFRRLVLMVVPTTGATRSAAAQIYHGAAEMIEQRGKAAWERTMRQFPKPSIFAERPNYPLDADVTEDLLPSVLRGAADTDLPPAEALAALTHPALVLAWDTDRVHPISSAEFLADTLPDVTLHIATSAADIVTWPEHIEKFLAA